MRELSGQIWHLEQYNQERSAVCSEDKHYQTVAKVGPPSNLVPSRKGSRQMRLFDYLFFGIKTCGAFIVHLTVTS